MENLETYFATQAAALMAVEDETRRRGYDIVYADRLWAEHVAYGSTVKYSFPLTVVKTGNEAKKWVHIQIYRMGSGKYELNFYIA
jgi:hypothetical protein